MLDLGVEDQDVGQRRRRDGDVAACLCASPQPVAGARALSLGRISYLPLATPAYRERHFPAGL
ncbi:hypothetical protein Q6294_34280, partial [Klebsiella pneumoniae]|nr:hypothetical protein [Klebsiella pneumoniae]